MKVKRSPIVRNNYFSKPDVYYILETFELTMKGFDSTIEMEKLDFTINDDDPASFDTIDELFNDVRTGSPIYDIVDKEGNLIIEGPFSIHYDIMYRNTSHNIQNWTNSSELTCLEHLDCQIKLNNHLKILLDRLIIDKFEICDIDFYDSYIKVYINNLNDIETFGGYDSNVPLEPEEEMVDESLPRQSSINQLKKLKRISKNTDIGNRIKSTPIGNLISDSSPISRVESYEEFTKKNKKFIPGWNVKGLKSPFKND